MFQRTLDLYHDQIVIGSDLSALSYAYMNKCTLIFKHLLKPYKYNKEDNWNEQKALWDKLAFLLSQASYIPFNNNIDSIRIEDKNLLKVFTKNNLVVNMHFNNLIISDDTDVMGLPPVYKKTNNNYWVIDYFSVPCGCNHDLEYISGNDNFVKKIYFYQSKRTLKKDTKDLVAVSIIDGKDVYYFDHSQSIVRLKVIKMMKEAGIKGRPNGYYKGRRAHRPIHIESINRFVYPLGKNTYKELPNNINILYDDYREILNKEEIKSEKIEKIKKLYGIN